MQALFGTFSAQLFPASNCTNAGLWLVGKRPFQLLGVSLVGRVIPLDWVQEASFTGGLENRKNWAMA
jgi:hypothetical protein